MVSLLIYSCQGTSVNTNARLDFLISQNEVMIDSLSDVYRHSLELSFFTPTYFESLPRESKDKLFRAQGLLIDRFEDLYKFSFLTDEDVATYLNDPTRRVHIAKAMIESLKPARLELVALREALKNEALNTLPSVKTLDTRLFIFLEGTKIIDNSIDESNLVQVAQVLNQSIKEQYNKLLYSIEKFNKSLITFKCS